MPGCCSRDCLASESLDRSFQILSRLSFIRVDEPLGTEYDRTLQEGAQDATPLRTEFDFWHPRILLPDLNFVLVESFSFSTENREIYVNKNSLVNIAWHGIVGGYQDQRVDTLGDSAEDSGRKRG